MSLPPIRLPQTRKTLHPTDRAWPKGLASLRPAPPIVHLAGHLSERPRLAIVGTRRADPEALEHAHELAREFASLGAVIVSGGARGIDAAAHRGALGGGGETIAVLATGIVHAYPPEHAELFSAIAASGALLSEEQDAKPNRWRFLRRNKIIAALADALVVVQAPNRSGALSTAAAARSLERHVFVTPAAPWDPRGAGCLRLLRSGAQLADVSAIRQKLGLAKGASAHRKRRRRGNAPAGLSRLDPECQRVFRCLGAIPRHVDELASRTGFDMSTIQRALTFLRLSNLIEERGAGHIVARHHRQPG